MANFDIAVEKTLAHEGGYVNDPADPGGETKYGISKRSYPGEDIKNLTKARAKEIYKRDFWDKVQGDRIPSQESANSVFDMAVNAGPSKALSMAKQALIAIGGTSLYALDQMRGKDFSRAFGQLRISFYRDLVARKPGMKKFLKGWEKRAKNFFNPSSAGLVLTAGAIGLVAWYMLKHQKKGMT